MNIKYLGLFGLCFLGLSGVSCHDDCEKIGCIVGEWTWVESVGGFGGWTITPESEMMTERLHIDDFIFQEYRNDTLAFESEYDIGVSTKSLIGTPERTYIEFKSGGRLAITAERSELELFDQCFDCYVHKFIRK